MTNALRRTLLILPRLPAVLAALSLSACNEPQAKTSPPRDNQRVNPQQVAAMREPNVLGVAAFYDPFDPWLWTESHEKPRGIIIKALYLQGPNAKGVFGDGVIRPRLYVRELNDRGEVNWILVKEWTFTVEDAVPFRSKKQSEMGWGYRLHLPWEDLARLAGREVRMVVEFDRIDGRRVTSGKKDFRVPAPGTT